MELLQVFDGNKEMLDEYVLRSEKNNLCNGKYFMVVLIFIQNDKGEFLIQKVSKRKGGVYATTGGHVTYGDSSIDTVLKETKEELGLSLNRDDVKYVYSNRDKNCYIDTYYCHINVDDFVLQESEVESVSWLSIDEINELIKKKEFREVNILHLQEVLKYLGKYTGREIAIFTDAHALLEPTKAILEDIDHLGIKEIYSLGDNIGVGPNPEEVLDLLDKYKVKVINGNSEEYSILGIEPFNYFHPIKIESQNWTRSHVRDEQVEKLKLNKHSYDLLVGYKKIGLCHFINDVRIDYEKYSTWLYQDMIRDDYLNAQNQFYYENSEEQREKIIKHLDNKPINKGYLSVNKEPLFEGKMIDKYDEIIEGHVHFKMYSFDDKVGVRTLRAVGLAYDSDEKLDEAYYIIIREKNFGYDIEERYVKYDRNSMLESINNSDMPRKEKILKFIREKTN